MFDSASFILSSILEFGVDITLGSFGSLFIKFLFSKSKGATPNNGSSQKNLNDATILYSVDEDKFEELHMYVRRASAWGFHPFDPDEEKREIKRCFHSRHGTGSEPQVSENGARQIIGGVAPHAGLIYSGPIASHLYHRLAQDGRPETFVILGVSHGGNPGFATMFDAVWRMPMGDVAVDAELAKAIVRGSEFIDINPEAHEGEHSIEIQLPFLQYIYDGKFKIVPITVGYGDYEMCENVGTAIAEATRDLGRDIVIIGSTDFTHYGPLYGYTPVGTRPFEKVLKWVYETDRSLIETIISLDAEGLIRKVRENNYTMCGYLPVATMIVAAKKMGASKGDLLKYATSYDVQGSTDAIVGYASIVIKE